MGTVPVVPVQDPEQSIILTRDIANPYASIWWTQQSVSGVPEHVMGWLVAQGFEVTDVAEDTSTTPSTYTYSLGKYGMQPWQVLLSLCNSYTIAANDARDFNEARYNEIVEAWTEMISSTQTHFSAEVDRQNADLGVYISDLDTYLDGIVTAIDGNRDDLTGDYDAHALLARGFLDDLGTTELARINEHFAATLSQQLSDLTDRGLYSSAVVTDITARNTRDKDEQIQALNDRLAREKLANQHQLYGQQVQLAQYKHQVVAAKMNAYVAKFEAWKGVHADNMKLMAYQLDERNKLLIGLYLFVERREDIGPEWKDMASMIAGLGDAAGGWLTP